MPKVTDVNKLCEFVVLTSTILQHDNDVSTGPQQVHSQLYNKSTNRSNGVSTMCHTCMGETCVPRVYTELFGFARFAALVPVRCGEDRPEAIAHDFVVVFGVFQHRNHRLCIPSNRAATSQRAYTVTATVTTSYRPGGGETICARRRQFDWRRRIYVRPRTGLQSTHLWWPVVAKLQAASVPIA